MEREADMIGVELMGRACFDPMNAHTVFARMEADDKRKGGGGGSSSYLSTHPGHGERVGNLKVRLGENDVSSSTPSGQTCHLTLFLARRHRRNGVGRLRSEIGVGRKSVGR